MRLAKLGLLHSFTHLFRRCRIIHAYTHPTQPAGVCLGLFREDCPDRPSQPSRSSGLLWKIPSFLFVDAYASYYARAPQRSHNSREVICFRPWSGAGFQPSYEPLSSQTAYRTHNGYTRHHVPNDPRPRTCSCKVRDTTYSRRHCSCDRPLPSQAQKLCKAHSLFY